MCNAQCREALCVLHSLVRHSLLIVSDSPYKHEDTTVVFDNNCKQSVYVVVD